MSAEADRYKTMLAYPAANNRRSIVSAFGVGCFHFGIRVNAPVQFSPEGYIRDLRSCLERIDAVSDVEIEYLPETDSSEVTTIDEQPPALDDGDYFPVINFLSYRFSLYIPYRLQASLWDVPEAALSTESEHFTIRTQYGFFGPATIVEAKGASADSSPSTSVGIIRKYLERQFRDESLPLKFEFIGPSPFHVDFYIAADADSSDVQHDLRAEYAQQPGYDRITFVTGATPDGLTEKVFESLIDELSFYYQLQRNRSVRIHSWAQIHESVRAATKSPPHESLVNRTLGIFKKRSQLKEAIHNLLSFQADSVFFISGLREDYRSVYETGKQPTFLRDYVDGKIQDLPEYPTAELLQMLKFEDDRHTKLFEWSTLISAASIGGIVGALVAGWLR